MRTENMMKIKRFLMTGLIVALLIPMLFGGIRSVAAVSPIYVDDSWVGTVVGEDPDNAGPATSFGTDSFATIQEGVNAVDAGGTVLVNAGTYVEQVHIAADITLSGENNLTTIIQAPVIMNPACVSPLLTNHPIICVDSNASPTIQGFTVDGAFSAATHLRLIGIALRQAGGTIQGNILKNLCFQTDLDPLCDPNGADEGVGIYVLNSDLTSRSVSILNNSINNFNKNGITITTSFNSGNPTVFTVSDNTIVGMVGESGLYNSTVAQNGIQVQVPNGGGMIQNNTISNIAYNNNGKLPFIGVSILSISTAADAVNNVITGSQAGIVYFNDFEDVGNYRQITGNQIQVIKPGTVTNPGQNVYGILVTDRPKDILSPIDPPVLLNSLSAQLNGSPLYVLVQDNTVTYTGTLSNTKTFGIEIDAAVGDNMLTVDVLNNQIGALNDGFDVGLAYYHCGPANLPPDPTITICGTGSLENSRIVSNSISGNNYGVFAVGPIIQSRLDDFHHNRIAGNLVGLQNDTGFDIGMLNNWWGCNGGPGAPGCNPVLNNIPDLTAPWLVLSTTANPTAVALGGTSTLTADLKMNSLGENASANFFVPNGIPVTFSASLGSVDPLSGATASGAAPTNFTAPMIDSLSQVCATVDSQTVCSNVIVGNPLFVFLPLISK